MFWVIAALLHLEMPTDGTRTMKIFEEPSEAVFLDVDTIRRSGSEVGFWTSHLTKRGARTRKQWSIDCSRRNYSLLSVVEYQGSKIRAAGAVPPASRGPFGIVAGSRISALHAATCKSGDLL